MQESHENSASPTTIPRVLVTLAVAVAAGVVVTVLLWLLRDAFAAIDTFPTGSTLRGRGPMTLLVMVTAAAGWATATLGERLWGCVGWPLLISVVPSAIVVAAVVWILRRMLISTTSPTMDTAYLIVAVVVALTGSATVFWRSMR